MRIDGKWLLCDDGVIPPVVYSKILASDGEPKRVEFLLDSGAD